jgi:hypothetical protein
MLRTMAHNERAMHKEDVTQRKDMATKQKNLPQFQAGGLYFGCGGQI